MPANGGRIDEVTRRDVAAPPKTLLWQPRVGPNTPKKSRRRRRSLQHLLRYRGPRAHAYRIDLVNGKPFVPLAQRPLSGATRHILMTPSRSVPVPSVPWTRSASGRAHVLGGRAGEVIGSGRVFTERRSRARRRPEPSRLQGPRPVRQRMA